MKDHVKSSAIAWVLVRGFYLSYHDRETMLFAIDPHSGNLKITSPNKNPVACGYDLLWKTLNPKP